MTLRTKLKRVKKLHKMLKDISISEIEEYVSIVKFLTKEEVKSNKIGFKNK